jgi:hypothetical protein
MGIMDFLASLEFNLFLDFLACLGLGLGLDFLASLGLALVLDFLASLGLDLILDCLASLGLISFWTSWQPSPAKGPYKRAPRQPSYSEAVLKTTGCLIMLFFSVSFYSLTCWC